MKSRLEFLTTYEGAGVGIVILDINQELNRLRKQQVATLKGA